MSFLVIDNQVGTHHGLYGEGWFPTVSCSLKQKVVMEVSYIFTAGAWSLGKIQPCQCVFCIRVIHW